MPKKPRLTQEQARELVEEHGSIRAAARALGVGLTVFRRCLDPEKMRAYNREAARKWSAKNLDTKRKRGLAYYHGLRDAGLCTGCRKPYSGATCWDCSVRKNTALREKYANDPEYRERVLTRNRFNKLANPPMRINY